MRSSTVVGLAAAGVVAAPIAARRRWSQAPDATSGHCMDLPAGRDFTISTSDGAVLAGRECASGDGPLVVLAHGWTADQRVWSATARLLTESGHRVVVYDQRGHGRSTAGSADLSVATLASDLRAVLEGIDAHDAILVGHSMGGMAAQRFAIDHKDALADRVAALVLVSTTAQHVLVGNRFASMLAGALGVTVSRAIGNPHVGPFLVRATVGRDAVAGHLDATVATFAATPHEVRRAFLDSMIEMDHTPYLGSITVPTVVVSGTRDVLTLHGRSRLLASEIPGAELVVVPGAGHQLVFEAPGRLAELIGGLSA
jgi:3-oxoadipate enol-lactonase